jgi:hypothetical protein
MSQTHQWDPGLLSTDTVEFDRALKKLRKSAAYLCENPALIGELATRLKNQVDIPRREFDRRFRLIVAAIVQDNAEALPVIAGHLRTTSPEALNAVRTLLPPELRHVTVQSVAQPVKPPSDVVLPTLAWSRLGQSQVTSRFSAVALIGTPEEHVRNEGLLRSADLDPLRLPSLNQLWDVGQTGLCGFVIGGSAWGQVPQSDQRRSIRRICEYSTFLFVRICTDGLSPAIAPHFLQHAQEARCGVLDGARFCHGQDCDLTPADIVVLQRIARLLDAGDESDFFPLELSEEDAALLRLIAADRRNPSGPLTSGKLGTRELAGGQSGARVFLLSDGFSQPFVAKVGDAELLTLELERYHTWIASWETCVTQPTFHAHLGCAAIAYRLQSSADGAGAPAPTLEDRLEQLRLAELNPQIDKAGQMADDLYQALVRAIDRLVVLNSRPARDSNPNEFWLDAPIRQLAARGIDITVVDPSWRSIELSELIQQAMLIIQPHVGRGVIHGDIHGRNILLLDRIPAFIDFALSGPGHPLEDLARLDAVVRLSAMRMLLDDRSMQEIIKAIYIDGSPAEAILGEYPPFEASPLAKLAIRTATKVRQAALSVAEAHSLRLRDFLAMSCVVASYVLAVQNPGAATERLILSVLGVYLGQLVHRPLGCE